MMKKVHFYHHALRLIVLLHDKSFDTFPSIEAFYRLYLSAFAASSTIEVTDSKPPPARYQVSAFK